MKLKNSFLSLTLALATTGGISSVAHADLLTYYNFEDSSATANTPPNLVSDAPGQQSTTITTTFDAGQGTNQATLNVLTFGGTTVNAAPGNTQGTNRALALQAGDDADPATAGVQPENNGRNLQFNFNTTNHNNIMLSYATQSTGTGFKTQVLSYSTDGTTFAIFGSGSLATLPTAFATNTFDLSGVTAINDQSNVFFRLTFDGATSAAGNSRLDNIQVNGASFGPVAPVPEPSTIALFVIGLGGMGFAVRRKKSADAMATGGSALLPC